MRVLPPLWIRKCAMTVNDDNSDADLSFSSLDDTNAPHRGKVDVTYTQDLSVNISTSMGVVVGRNVQSYIAHSEVEVDPLDDLFRSVFDQIQRRPDEPSFDRSQAINSLHWIQNEFGKGEAAIPSRLENWLRDLLQADPQSGLLLLNGLKNLDIPLAPPVSQAVQAVINSLPASGPVGAAISPLASTAETATGLKSVLTSPATQPPEDLFRTELENSSIPSRERCLDLLADLQVEMKNGGQVDLRRVQIDLKELIVRLSEESPDLLARLTHWLLDSTDIPASMRFVARSMLR
jgi:hypothetical protein